MTDLWLASYIVLWVIVIAMFVVVLALLRLVGLLYSRFPPYGARGSSEGMAIGNQLPAFRGTALDGRAIAIPELGNPLPWLVVFVSPNCGACSELAPAIRSIWRSDRKALNLLLVGASGDEAQARTFAFEHHLASIPYVVAPEWAAANKILGTPFVIAADAESKVLAKGVANHLEHLDSLLSVLTDTHANLAATPHAVN